MRLSPTTTALALAGILLAAASAEARPVEERFERKGRGEWTYEYKDRVRQVKRERKKDGEWKEEIKDGRCEVKRERKRDGALKEEVKCD